MLNIFKIVVGDSVVVPILSGCFEFDQRFVECFLGSLLIYINPAEEERAGCVALIVLFSGHTFEIL